MNSRTSVTIYTPPSVYKETQSSHPASLSAAQAHLVLQLEKMRAGCLVIFLASLMVGLVHCAPEGAREEIVNDYEDSTQQDEPMYDDDDNEDDDDDGDDDDENGDEEEYDVMERRSADVEFDNPSDVSDKVDTSIKPINGVTDGKTDKQGGVGVSCTNKPLRSKCGRPHLPKHGGVRLNGQYLSYYCHKGYSLHGAKSNRCVRTYRKHRWIHSAPKCKRSRSHR